MMKVPFKKIEYAPKAGQRLIERFRQSGLQIIVKLASIELTPEKPHFPVGGWHVEGQMNESICATALYYLDSENITDSSLSFRMQTSAYMNDDRGYDVGQDAYHWMEAVYGTSLGCGNAPCLQNYGNVQTRQGRLLAFPNVFQHRVSPFELVEPTKPGHRRFIALWLVDPTKRIISTANVPPQQMTWYVDALFGSSGKAREEALSKLPAELLILLAEKGLTDVAANTNSRLSEELMDVVRDYFDADKYQLPMSVDEANEHRAKLMKERGAFVKTTESGWQQQTYSFCEH
jgi:septum formation topological specificity factor MinE